MIDENPFAYFLTSPEEVDDDIEDLSAGIESDTPKPIIRSVSPSSLQRECGSVDPSEDPYPESSSVEDNTSAAHVGIAIPMTLREFSAHQIRSPSSSSNLSRERESVERVNRVVKETPRRGRGKVRLAPGGLGKMRGTRSLSARRPRSWKEPSPDVWSIPEGHESGSSQEEIEKEKEVRVESPRSPGKKTVRWAVP